MTPTMVWAVGTPLIIAFTVFSILRERQRVKRFQAQVRDLNALERRIVQREPTPTGELVTLECGHQISLICHPVQALTC